AHGAGEVRRGRAVAARVTPGAELARILQRRARRARGEPVQLQYAPAVAAANRGRCRITGSEQAVHAGGTAAAELAVAFLLASAQVDRIEIIPHAQHVALFAAIAAPALQRRVGVAGCAGEAAVRGFVDFELGEVVVAIVAEANFAVAAAADVAAA